MRQSVVSEGQEWQSDGNRGRRNPDTQQNSSQVINHLIVSRKERVPLQWSCCFSTVPSADRCFIGLQAYRETRWQRSAWGISMAWFARSQAWTPKTTTPWTAGRVGFFGISTVNFERIKAAHFSRQCLKKQITNCCLFIGLHAGKSLKSVWLESMNTTHSRWRWVTVHMKKKKGLSRARIQR